MPLKQKIRSNELTLGTWLTLSSPETAEILAGAGFDWIAVDMEHSAISIHQAQALIQVISLSGAAPLVRVGRNDPYLIKRVMDAGAHGIIVPMVNSKKEAEEAVQSLYYPPKGKRGVGLARAQKYGFGFEAYKTWLEKEAVLVVQIEHKDAIANLDAILSVEEIDATLVGPYDLSGSLGSPGDFASAPFRGALTAYSETSKKRKKTTGFHVIPPQLAAVEEKVAQGFRFVGWSLDTLFLGTAAGEGIRQLRKTSARSR